MNISTSQRGKGPPMYQITKTFACLFVRLMPVFVLEKRPSFGHIFAKKASV